MDFVTKSFRKDETLTSWTFLQHICPHFWAWLLNTIAITPKSEDKYVVKVFNWSEFHLSEMNLLQNPYFSDMLLYLPRYVLLFQCFAIYWFVFNANFSELCKQQNYSYPVPSLWQLHWYQTCLAIISDTCPIPILKFFCLFN